MSETKQDWFIADRARTLALLHLTRRKDLVVTEPGKEICLEFLVYITREEGEPSLRQFGVFLRGTKSATTEAGLNKVLRPTSKASFGSVSFPSLPVCSISRWTMTRAISPGSRNRSLRIKGQNS